MMLRRAVSSPRANHSTSTSMAQLEGVRGILQNQTTINQTRSREPKNAMFAILHFTSRPCAHSSRAATAANKATSQLSAPKLPSRSRLIVLLRRPSLRRLLASTSTTLCFRGEEGELQLSLILNK
ncbi:hypothetical protein CB0940_07975 [Cercospora beticola]|uniref:Uncharacterized protein n=1 Tax=Cercospora beticola TaxID=122368 RepID=A0A2G5HR70_CERBT|nr:hypothetical protein CB0940_07975 [Cercospora beticola]PIA94722.1 hypothetical protein CB0940_07975 [Cercospora beticola]